MATTPAPADPLERALQERVAAGTLRLPPYPAVALRVQEALGRKDAGLSAVTQLVRADAVLTAAILRYANSAALRRGAPVSDLLAALTRIGSAELVRLLLASGLSAEAQAAGPLAPLRRLIWIEGLASAAVCQELARLRGLRSEEAFVLGLLHDFGKVVCCAALEALLEEGSLKGRWPVPAWAAAVESQHVAAGLSLAAAWKLPPLVGQVIGAHHGSRPGARSASDPGLLEVVVASDRVVSLLVSRSRVTAADLAPVEGLSAEERGPVERVLECVPDLVAAFETSGSAPQAASPGVAPPEPPPAGPSRPVRLAVSISVARRQRQYQASAVSADGLMLHGEEPVPEGRLLEARVQAPEPFTMWVLTRSCRETPEEYQIEVQPFALTGAVREAWGRLVSAA